MRAMNSESNVLLLVDGSSYLYRAYHALPDLRGPEGVPTGAIHGMVAMLRRALLDVKPQHAVCVFDAKGKTFRDDLYADYKATRSAMPEPLAQQIEAIHEVVRLLGWPVLSVPGIEADDAIGTLARVAAEAGHRVVISTGDKDLAQLVNPQVTLINTMSGERLDEAGVLAKFGVPPSRIVDYLSLVGDAVDNVPGVDKVGPKTAAKWIAEYGSLDAVMAAAPGMKGAVGENLRKAIDWLPMGKRLVTVVTDCELSGHVAGWPSLDALALREVETERLLEFYARFGFKSWRRELEEGVSPAAVASADAQASLSASDAEASAAPVQTSYECVLDVEALERWAARIEAAPLTAIDTETDSLDPMRAQLVGISLSVAVGEAAYIPIRHRYAGAPDQLTIETVLARLEPWLENPQAAKVGQNTKYDSHVLANAGIAIRGYLHDTLLQS